MTNQADEHERTMAFAGIALGQIKALRQPASPRHYEVWYAYATGYNPSLNQMINETVARNGTLSDADIDEIYETYISANRFTDRIDQVGTQVMGEIEQVMAMIGAAAGSANSYTESLADVTQKLGHTKDNDGLRSIVEGLVQAAKEMEKNNKALEARLTASKSEITQLQEHLETVRNESLTDPLTQLANRKYFDDSLAKAIEDSFTKHEPLSLMMTDVDHFKKFNDTFGHLTGDQVLRLVAMSLKQNVKGQDIAARYGGEEFALIFPGETAANIHSMLSDVLKEIASRSLRRRSTNEELGAITVSASVAELKNKETAHTLLERADAALYDSKRAGRNRVTNAEGSPGEAAA